jgi:hypothetical protein
VRTAAGGAAQGAVSIDEVLTVEAVAALKAKFQKLYKILQYLGCITTASFIS